MAYNTVAILTDVNGKPVPQYYDAALDTFVVMSDEFVIPSTAAQGSDTITRPANTTAYTAGDVISTTAGEIMEFATMGQANDIVSILGVDLMIAQNAVPTACAGYRLHLYNAAPTAIADADPYNLPSGDRAKYLGYVDIGVPVDIGDTVISVNDNINHMVKLAGTSLYGILQAKAAETPASGSVYTVTVKVVEI